MLSRKQTYSGEQTPLLAIISGVPQGSVLGPLRYLLFPADLSINDNIITVTFADGKVILASHLYTLHIIQTCLEK